ncbi:lectin, partial [Sistotremastrum niveocremeum HHB9708]
MPYTITARVFQTNPKTFFRLVENTVWNYANGGTWNLNEGDGEYVLNMTGSGTSGALRFVNDTGENFVATLGIHNFLRWGHIVTNIPGDQTGLTVNTSYYNGNPDRAAAREAQNTHFQVQNPQRTFTLNYAVADGDNLVVNITIG